VPPGKNTCEAAVVVTVTVAVAAVVPLKVTVAGEMLHAAMAGAPLHVSVTLGFSPPLGVSAIKYVAACPGITVALAAPLAANEKSCPVPVSVTT
jgi:hypothetical protein